MTEVYAALAGAIAAGVFALVGVCVGHLVESRRATRQQAQREAEWLRDKLFDVYSDGIYYLVKLAISSAKGSTNDDDVRQHYSESVRNLNLLMGFHADSTAARASLESATQRLAKGADGDGELGNSAEAALAIVKSLFRLDQRIQGRHQTAVRMDSDQV